MQIDERHQLDQMLITRPVKQYLTSTPAQTDNVKVIYIDNGRPDCENYTNASQEFKRHDELMIYLDSVYYAVSHQRYSS